MPHKYISIPQWPIWNLKPKDLYEPDVSGCWHTIHIHISPCSAKVGRIREMMTAASIGAGVTGRQLCYFNALLRNHFNKTCSSLYYYYRPRATNILFFPDISCNKDILATQNPISSPKKPIADEKRTCGDSAKLTASKPPSHPKNPPNSPILPLSGPICGLARNLQNKE